MSPAQGTWRRDDSPLPPISLNSPQIALHFDTVSVFLKLACLHSSRFTQRRVVQRAIFLLRENRPIECRFCAIAGEISVNGLIDQVL